MYCELLFNYFEVIYSIKIGMYYNPEPEPKKELSKFADIGDNCDYNYDCDWGNRDKLHWQRYLCNQTINQCFFMG